MSFARFVKSKAEEEEEVDTIPSNPSTSNWHHFRILERKCHSGKGPGSTSQISESRSCSLRWIFDWKPGITISS